MTNPVKFRSATGEEINLAIEPMHTATVGAEWTELNPMFHRLAMANGCLRSDMSAAAIQVMTKADTAEPESSGSQDDLVIAALDAMKQEGAEEDFTAAGYPDLRRLRARVGFGVDRVDMVRLWNKLNGVDIQMDDDDNYGDAA